MSTTQNQEHRETIVDIAQKVTEGQIPSNESIKAQLDPLIDHLNTAEKKSGGLQKAEVYHQTKELVKTIEQTLDEKNAGDKLQKLAAAAAKVAERTTPADTTGPVWDQTKEFVSILKDLATSLISSKEFRQSLVDLFGILKDITTLEGDKIAPAEKAKEGIVEGKPLEAAQEIINKASDIATNLPDEIPELQKRRLRENVKKLLTQLRNQPDTSHAFKKFIRLMSLIQTQVAAHVAATQVDKDVRQVEELAVDLVDSFLQGKSIHQLIERIKTFVERIQSDEELSNLLHESREFVEKSFQNPELIDSDKFYDDAEQLYKKARKLTKKYQKDRIFDKILDESQEIMKTFKSDTKLNELQYRAGKVAESLTYTDITGTRHLDYDIIGAMRKEMVPFMIEQINEIPIPGFIISNEDFEYIEVKDLYCKLGDVLPDKIHIRAMNDTDLSMKDLENPVQSESYVKFHMEGLRPEFKDFYFTFKKKGMVKLEDEGRANLKLTGDGIVIDTKFKLDVDGNNRTILGKHQVEIKTDGIDLDIIEAEHKVLLNLVSTLFAPQLRKGFETALTKRFEEIGNDWAAYMNKRVMTTLPTMRDIGEKIASSALPLQQ